MGLNSTSDIKISDQIYIGRTPGVCGGALIILGTRIRVEDIVILMRAGRGLSGILKAYPHLTDVQVHAALEYYNNHKQEVDDEWDNECEG